jgi:hypothetical protein
MKMRLFILYSFTFFLNVLILDDCENKLESKLDDIHFTCDEEQNMNSNAQDICGRSESSIPFVRKGPKESTKETTIIDDSLTEGIISFLFIFDFYISDHVL